MLKAGLEVFVPLGMQIVRGPGYKHKSKLHEFWRYVGNREGGLGVFRGLKPVMVNTQIIPQILCGTNDNDPTHQTDESG